MVKGNDVNERKIVIEGELGFPSNMYFGLLGILSSHGYNMAKYEDWIEINPNSDYYQDFVQKRANIEQQVSRVLSNISDMRKQVEMLRHDKRKIERIIRHHDEGNLDVLKSDFVDLVDKHTSMSMLDLANSGRFPSIVVDFYKIDEEDDIEELNISRGEKEVLRKKWTLFQDWLDGFVSELKNRKRMIESELTNRKRSVEHYKEVLQPYAKALERVKVRDEPKYKTIKSPAIVEMYSTSVSGVGLYAWKEIWMDGERRMNKEKDVNPVEGIRSDYVNFLDVKIEKLSIVKEGNQHEELSITITGYVVHTKDLKKILDELDNKNKKLLRNIQELKGEDIPEDLEDEPIEEEKAKTGLWKIIDRIDTGIRKLLLTVPKDEGGSWLPFRTDARKGILGKKVGEEVDEIYDELKEKIGGLKTKRAG